MKKPYDKRTLKAVYKKLLPGAQGGGGMLGEWHEGYRQAEANARKTILKMIKEIENQENQEEVNNVKRKIRNN